MFLQYVQSRYSTVWFQFNITQKGSEIFAHFVKIFPLGALQLTVAG